METPNVFMIPDGNSGGNSNNTDFATLYALMNSNNSGLGGGGVLWVLFLFFLWPLLRNGGMFGNMNGNGSAAGLGYLGNMVNNNDGRDMLMQAISRNGNDVQSLANMFNTSSANIMQAINAAQNAITGVGNNVNLTGQQIINAVMGGNNQIISQLCTNACNIRQSITDGNYQNQIATLNQTHELDTRIDYFHNDFNNKFSAAQYQSAHEFCETRHALADQTQALKDNANANHREVMQKLDGMERSAMQDKINTLTSEKSSLQTQLNIEHQNGTFASMLSPISTTIATMQQQINALVAASGNATKTTTT